MRIGVLGNGMVGKTLAARLAGLGHQVMVGTRDPGNPQRGCLRLGADSQRNERWRQPGGLAERRGRKPGREGADGHRQPSRFLARNAPSLSGVKTDSMAEQIQREFPEARVVKTLNTTKASIMVDPRAVSGGDHTVFLCGNDDEAKATVRGILESFGWTDIIDLGDITAARGSEMILPIWLSLMIALNTAASTSRS